MQTCTVEVFLGGDRGNSSVLQNVTPPEVLLLQAIHGATSVEYRGERDEGKHNHGDEIERLREKYKVSDPTVVGAKVPIFNRLFPGASPKLPIRFLEIGFGMGEPEVRILPDKPGFHGDTKPPAPAVEDDDWEDDEPEVPASFEAALEDLEEGRVADAEEVPSDAPAPEEKRKPGRPKKA